MELLKHSAWAPADRTPVAGQPWTDQAWHIFHALEHERSQRDGAREGSYTNEVPLGSSRDFASKGVTF